MICSKAVIIGSVKYGDNSSIITLFTREAGMVSFMCRRKLHLLPMSIVEVCFENRHNKRIQYFKDIKLITPFTGLAEHPYKMTIVMFLAEVLRYALREEKESADVFDYIEKEMSWLDVAENEFSSFHITFLTNILKFLGYNPEFDTSITKEPRLMNHNERNHHTEILMDYYRQHLPSFPAIKSLEVLKGIFS